MGATVEVQKLGLKVFVDQPQGVDVQSFMETFNEWIRDKSVPGILIDIADYTHMHHGPGVMLVSHEANWSMDEEGGRLGLLVAVKVQEQGSLAERIEQVFKRVYLGCRLIEGTPRHRGIQFNRGHFVFMAGDRLTAVHDDDTLQQLTTALKAHIAKNFQDANPVIHFEQDKRKRVALHVQLSKAARI